MRKKILSMLLVAAMVIGTMPLSANAADCEHHFEHTEDCGYVEAKEGSACTHEHGEECYVDGTCLHTEHDEFCEYAEATEESEGKECNHVCGEECKAKVEACKHEHDETCGFVEAVEGTSCTFECKTCTFNEMVSALCKPEEVDPLNDEQKEKIHGDIQQIVTFALENGIYATQDEVTCHPTIAAVLEAMYPIEQPDVNASVVATIGETTYTDLKTAFLAVKNGDTITLTKDAQITVTDWEEISTSNVTVEGNGATIKGLTKPLIMNATSGITITNLTIADSQIVGVHTVQSGSETAGAFIGFEGYDVAKLKNCHVMNSSITSNGYAGGLIGYDSAGNSGLTLENCSVKDTVLNGGSSTGALVGHSNGGITVINSSVGGNTVTSTDGEGWQGAVFGVLTGGSNNQVEVKETAPSSTSNNSELYVIGGRLTNVTYDKNSVFITDPAGEGANEWNDATKEDVIPSEPGYGFVKDEEGKFVNTKLPVIATIGTTEYTNLKKAFADLAVSGGTLELAKDAVIPLTSDWGEVNLSTNVTINGNGATITGLTNPLVMNATGTLVINDLTIDNSQIVGFDTTHTGAGTAGGVVGYANANTVLDNCTVKNSSVTSAKYSGGLIGYAAEGVEINNCNVFNTTVKGQTVGGMVGHSNSTMTITGKVGSNIMENTSNEPEKEGSVAGTFVGGLTNTINVIETEPSKGTLYNPLYIVGRRYTEVKYTGGSYFTNPDDCGLKDTDEKSAPTSYANGFKPLENSDGTYSINKELTITGTLVAVNREYDGTDVVKITGGVLEGVPDGVDVQLDYLIGTVADKNVGDNKAVTITGYVLKGKDAGKYMIDLESDAIKALAINLTVNITPKKETLKSESKETKEYDYLEGQRQTIVLGDEATFRIDGEYKDFVKVKVDGETISSDKYKSQEGSTIITLRSSYTRTLSEGDHELTVVFTDGQATTKFTVISEAVYLASITPVQRTGGVPATGDDSNTVLWTVLMLSCAVVVAASIKISKRKNRL